LYSFEKSKEKLVQ